MSGAVVKHQGLLAYGAVVAAVGLTLILSLPSSWAWVLTIAGLLIVHAYIGLKNRPAPSQIFNEMANSTPEENNRQDGFDTQFIASAVGVVLGTELARYFGVPEVYDILVICAIGLLFSYLSQKYL